MPSIRQKKVTAAFDGGRISSDDRFCCWPGRPAAWPVDTLAALIPDHRGPSAEHSFDGDIRRARILAIACGYPDADDLDDLRKDPTFKLAYGRLPESGDDLASQPTMSRWAAFRGVDSRQRNADWENAPDRRTLLRMARAMADLWCQSHPRPPRAITLNNDDTADTVHGRQ
jgi:hypothetical protein